MTKTITSDLVTNTTDWFHSPGQDHLVQFYSSTTALMKPLSEYVKTGLQRGEACVVIATQAHESSLRSYLIANGVDIQSGRNKNLYMAYDAAATLAKFMINGLPDRQLFMREVGSVMKAASQKGKAVRAYGEMVALLWQDNNKQAVMLLEDYWDKLAEHYDFSLYCAYPELHFIMNQNDLEDIRECHSLHLVDSAE